MLEAGGGSGWEVANLRPWLPRNADTCHALHLGWHREVDVDQVEAELCFLEDLDFPEIAPLVTAIDAYIRFSDRLF